MNKFKILCVDKDELPKGIYVITYCNSIKIFIRSDLPLCVKNSILSHEQQHEKDCDKPEIINNFFLREIRGNLAGMKYPIGFITTVIMSIFSIDRWKLYISLIFKGDN